MCLVDGMKPTTSYIGRQVLCGQNFPMKQLSDQNSLCAELLSFYKFPGDDIPIVRGSALAALNGTNDELGKNAILKLMQAVDEYIPEPKRNLDILFYSDRA
jgi:translation elongation factor EF-Tu-like GTPase